MVFALREGFLRDQSLAIVCDDSVITNTPPALLQLRAAQPTYGYADNTARIL